MDGATCWRYLAPVMRAEAATQIPDVGDRIRFAPSPRWPDCKVEAVVIRWRDDPLGESLSGRSRKGWLDTRDDDGKTRSVRAARCEVVARLKG